MILARNIAVWLMLAVALTPAITLAAQYELLTAKPRSDQIIILQYSIISSGNTCPGVKRFQFNGADKDQAGYWAVSCSDGDEWMVQINNDADASSRILACEVAKMLSIDCWKKFD